MSLHLTPGQQALLDADLRQRQRALTQELQDQMGSQNRVEHAREQLQQEVDGEQAHQADREVDLARSDQLLLELSQVNDALQRVHAPDFGQCSDCGGAIAFDRLRLNPAATRCIGCQAKIERPSRASSL
ncbi:TraR/DksA family transcriptional regulator [Roseateles koreensis]|uniref:TraR/DksA family transcriptional regulator n=1 Tax=Roseateles koreensis TaxID=2987526 RepID=A0ABT5KXP9_9BURK|nr:TraR/DksA family transcriptional regulator [Roseateles koreensis]MDC8786606.1 TraR/DksA family transcriptional regulator [Roseateles koreensis]